MLRPEHPPVRNRIPGSAQMHLIDHEIDQHIKSLGLISVSSYKLWCRRNGFSTSLEKSSSEQEAECAFLTAQAVPSDPRIHKNHSPRTAGYIQRIASGEFDGQPLSSMMSWIRTFFEEADEVDGGRQALLRLLLHVGKYANLLHSKQALRMLGQSRRNFIISGLSQLALHHKDWIRPVEEWFPVSRYLLARYPVPPCLDAAWFEPNDEERHTQQGWFKHIAGGQNIRTAGCLPFTLTKRAAHKFMTTKWHNPPLIALRSAQVETLSDSNLPSWSIATNEFMWGRENADFWTSIVHFFLNNPMLERSYIGPIIDYIHHQKFVARRIPQPDGTEIKAPPAHPNFCIKSRSINKLIREVDEWHASLTGEENEAVKEWEPSGIGNFELTENNEDLHCGVHWTIQELGRPPCSTSRDAECTIVWDPTRGSASKVRNRSFPSVHDRSQRTQSLMMNLKTSTTC